MRKFTAIILSVILCVAAAIPSFAATDMSKGLVVQGYDTLDDASVLGVQEILVNITSNNWNANKAAWVWLYDQMASRGFKLTAVILKNHNGSGAHYDMLTDADLGYVNDVVSTLGNKVSRYIIGNEINDSAWNYAGNLDCDSYCRKYADIFQKCYSTIKTANPGAEVYVPFTYLWYNANNPAGVYSGREMICRLGEYLPKEMDWGVAWHAYPDPVTDPNFLDDALAQDDTYAQVVNFKNLHVLTDLMQTPELRKQDGNVRNIILSEQGFTSNVNGRIDEQAQADAFTRSWEIAKADPYIKAYILSRQVDALGETRQGYAFGLWYCDGTAIEKPTVKKLIWEAYKNAN